jgi:hypothetical protein
VTYVECLVNEYLGYLIESGVQCGVNTEKCNENNFFNSGKT